MKERNEISTAHIVGSQVLQVCHNLRSPLSQFVTASIIGSQLTEDNPDLKRLFDIMSNAAHLFTDTVNIMERRVAYEEAVVPERLDIVAFLKQQMLFFEFDERMRYKTKSSLKANPESIEVEMIPSDVLLVLSNIMYLFLDRVTHAQQSTLDMEITTDNRELTLHLVQRCEWESVPSVQFADVWNSLFDHLEDVLRLNSITLTASESEARDVEVFFRAPICA